MTKLRTTSTSLSGHELPLDDLNYEKTPYDGFAGYCRSKVANLLFAKGLSRKLKVGTDLTQK